MKHASTFFLKIVLSLIALTVLAVCLIGIPIVLVSQPVGYYAPLLIGLYLPAVPFFLALAQAWKLLGEIDKNTAFSNTSLAALHTIKRCAVVISILFALGSPYIYYVADRDDAPGVLLIGIIIIGASIVIATFAAVLAKLIHSGVELKSENDLTV